MSLKRMCSSNEIVMSDTWMALPLLGKIKDNSNMFEMFG